MCTGQVWAARSSFCLFSGLRECGTWILTFRLAILLGGVVVISFSTVAVVPAMSIFNVRAMMPIAVSMQVPSAVATKSVGEKLSPRP